MSSHLSPPRLITLATTPVTKIGPGVYDSLDFGHLFLPDGPWSHIAYQDFAVGSKPVWPIPLSRQECSLLEIKGHPILITHL